MVPPPADPPRPNASAAAIDELRAEVRRAQELSTAGRPAQAARSVRAVRRRARGLGDHAEVQAVVARTYLTESTAVFDMTGDLDATLELVGQAEGLARGLRSDALLATVLGQRALVVLRSGDTRAALAAFDEAALLLDAMDPRDRAIVTLNRGVLHLEHTDLAHARDDLTRSVAFAEQARDARLEAMARHNLGYVDVLAGRIPRAISAYRRAAETMPGRPHPVMQLDLARSLSEAGLVADADEVLLAAVSRCREARLFQDLGETELARATCALAVDEPQRARTLALSAKRRFARRGNQRWQRKAELMVLRAERARLDAEGTRRSAGLLRLARGADELATACRAERRPELARSAEILAAECRLRAGQEAGAVSTRLRASDPLALRLQVREVRALAAGRNGDQRRALGEVRRGLAELSAFQQSLGSLDLRTAAAVHGVTLARIGLDVSLGVGRAGDVLEMVERSRAISTRLPQLRPPDDQRTAALLGELRRVEEDTRGLEDDPASAVALTRLRSRASALRHDIRARAWELEGDSDSGSVTAVSPSAVRTAVRSTGTVLVSFARHRGRWLAVVVRRGRAELHDLAPTGEVTELVRRVRADLDVLASPHLPGPVAGIVRTSLQAGLARLDALLLAPLRLDGEPVALSCSGPLTVTPWSLLPSRSALPTVVSPSAGTWLQGLTRERPVRPRVAALAGPGLHESEKEARAVAAIWPGAELLLDAAATTAAARTALARKDVLHVAAHGTHRQDSPLFSAMRLADGPLYAYELDPARGAPGCVTLSACEAGLATLRPGDEGLGLTHVLLHLGVASVVAGVARVRDEVAAATMQRVHEEMAAGADSALALARALADGHDGPAPAPFVAFGAAW